MRIRLVVLVMSIFAAQASMGEQQATVFEDVTVVSIETERAVPHQDVFIQGGVIQSVRPHAPRWRWSKNVEAVDGVGKYLLPGLSDMHIHTGFGDEQQLKLYLVNGVTTVLNLNGSPGILSWKAKIAAGEILGPTLYTSGPILDGDPPTSPDHVVVRNRREAETAVDEQARLGYDFIKPYSALSRDAYEGIVEGAKRNNLRLVGHVSWNVGVEDTIDAGQEAIAHMEELYRYFVDRHRKPPPDTRPDSRKVLLLADDLKRHGTWVITTLSANENMLQQATSLNDLVSSPETRFMPRTFLEGCRTDDPYARRGSDWVLQNKIMYPFLLQLTRGLHSAGVHLMAGTDATNPMQIPGLSLHRELELLVQSGFTPYEALVTATRNPQIFLGHLQTAGSVLPGKVADLVLLDGNPLQSISNTRRIRGVMVRGLWLDHGQLERMKQELVAHFAAE